MGVSTDDMVGGFGNLGSLENEERFYDFICTYVKRIRPDVKWRKMMKQTTAYPVFSFITPSDIAYVIALIVNGREVWDQAKRLMKDPDAQPEKKEKPLFSTGEGKKRESGKSVWNNHGLEFYYSVEKKWRATYNSTEEYNAMTNGWQKWEPAEKSKKDPLRTVWKPDKKKTNKEERNRWWDKEADGYDTDMGLRTEVTWDDNVLKKVREDGEGDESSDDDSDKDKSAGEKKADGDDDDEHDDDGKGQRKKTVVRASKRAKKGKQFG